MSDIEAKGPSGTASAESLPSCYEGPSEQVGKWQNFKDSFKRMDETEFDPNLSEEEKAIIATSKAPLNRSLKSRHLQMIAIGGSIGTGLFIGSGSALRTGGPASLLISYFLVGTIIYCVMQALAELAVTFPVSGAFSAHASRFVDASWAFAVGWNYLILWLVVLPLELVAASMTITYWNPGVSNAVWVAIFYVMIMFINMFGVRGYGEAEFVFSLIKVVAIIGFIILGVVLICGGGPSDDGYIGGRYWQHPGAFHSGFKGLCTVFVTALYSLAGTELVGLASAETKENPRKVLPKAIKQVFWRIILFYFVCLLILGLLVPYDDPRLIGSSSVDATASPFVIAIKNGGIKALPSIINVVILIAVLSVGNASVYGASRTIASLAAQNMAPSIFAYIDRSGRPIMGIIAQGVVGLLCFLAASPKQNEVFAWLMALCGMSTLFTWTSICICHLRFRAAIKAQGRTTDELAYTANTGVIGSYYSIAFLTFVLCAQFWVSVWPIGAKPSAVVFFQNYVSILVILVFYLGHKIWTRNWKLLIPLADIDLNSGRREMDLELIKQEMAEERAALAARPKYMRILKLWC
ncbi:hypothetical protein BABINDRAFT_163824 [Babjeviella inositovora NRRL Y-12698]|uniref:Amino acid permease/ SLC12A domain-containing protein n=1 Tax=Babjeviella inositovora NRRL Y-12698 TaxID=984486 RepID=A0A1E3QHI2_9ASCO|nr:uncharacterized protein BABINDRAFT_163824 [Babjeviella inositovora NRRL Y-12698]ODQ77090.1 hypothetical protein BABINDRAFT_163824 [Babjeviella inositovora NRRL Y-12698]